MTQIKISEIEQIFKEIFEDTKGKVKSVDTVFEKSDDNKFYKLVISIHGLVAEDTSIIHTKFIFKTDIKKQFLDEESFIYLYDINCVYKSVNFKNTFDLQKKIEDIIESNNFGKDIKILSDFIDSPAQFINNYFHSVNISDYSIFDVKYEPKFKTTPCDKTTFDFVINISNNYEVSVSITKTDKKNEDENNTYKMQFKFLGKYVDINVENLKNLQSTIGSNIVKLIESEIK